MLPAPGGPRRELRTGAFRRGWADCSATGRRPVLGDVTSLERARRVPIARRLVGSFKVIPLPASTVAPYNVAALALVVTQPRTTQLLTGSTGILRHRLAYRNFGEHESMVITHTVDVSGTVGVRWYELRPDGSGGLLIHQQSTFSPDAHHRFMPSAAMDARGNLAVGYSVSSDTVYPSIRYAGRLANDPPGVLTLGEGSLVEGAESQSNSARWGDYSSMQVDPADDCR